MKTLPPRFSIGGIIYRFRPFLFFFLLLLGTLSGIYLPSVQFEADFSKFFPPNAPDLKYFKQYESIFGTREHFLSIGVHHSEGVFDLEFLQKVKSFSNSCTSLKLVERAFTISSISNPLQTPFGWIYIPLIKLEEDVNISRDRAKAIKNPFVRSQLLSEDETMTVVILELNSERTPQQSQKFVDELNEIISSFNFESAHIIGISNLEVNYIRLTSSELSFFIKVGVILLIVLLFWVYRSILGILLPLSIFILSLLLLGGLLGFLGITLDTMSTMLPTIILIVSVSDVIHLFAKMRNLNNEDWNIRMEKVDKVIWTNFLTSLTTAIGFFTLLLSPMPTLRDFGLAVGLGVMVAYLLSSLIVPMVFFSFSLPVPTPRGIFDYYKWENQSKKFLALFLDRSGQILLGFGLLIVVAIIGVSGINFDRFLMSSIPLNHKIRDSYEFFEEKMGGVREFDLVITAKEENGLSKLENLKAIEKLHLHLDSFEVVGNVLSPITYFETMQYLRNRNRDSGSFLPQRQSELDSIGQKVPRGIERIFRTVLDSTMTYASIKGNMQDIGMIANYSLINNLDSWINKNLDTSALTFHSTGIPILTDRINTLQIEANFSGLIIAAVLISILMAILFKSPIFILITLLANLLPLLLIAGIVGFTDIEMRGGTSLIFSVAFVIIVDDTIHFLSNFLQVYRSSKEVGPALLETFQNTGHAILLTTLVLSIITMTLMFSIMPDVKNLGFLLSVSLLIALVCDLVLIPIFLKAAFSKFKAGHR